LLKLGRLPGRVSLLALVIVAVLATGTWFAMNHGQVKQTLLSSQTPAGGGTTQAPAVPLQVVSVTPAKHARHVNGADPVQVHFSTALAADSPMPVIKPKTAGSWQGTGTANLEFVPRTNFKPQTHVTVRIPGGAAGVRSAAGGTLPKRVLVKFRTGRYSTLRLDQLLAQLKYLPLKWAPASSVTPAAATDANAQRSAAFDPPDGVFTWKHGYPAELRTFWDEGQPSLVLQGAVMAFESAHGMAMDGVAGPAVWRALFKAVAAGQDNAQGYTYARATKYSPETLTIWHNGHVVFHELANTGIPAAPTTSGTAPVYLRYRNQIMRGTNPDGSKYADPVQFVAYFRAGEAVHYFPRGSYGFPQSLGCVELPLDAAAKAWPYLTYGSLVTVTNP
jgi:peptidoglycan hydrolase-like protein with peptidoglycan-binding domain